MRCGNTMVRQYGMQNPGPKIGRLSRLIHSCLRMRRTACVLTALVLSLALVSTAGADLLTPAGCIAAPGGQAGYAGYADRVIHQQTGIEMVLCPPGSFNMGTRTYQVTIAYAYYIGKTEVTNGQYQLFANTGYNGAADVDPEYDGYLRHKRALSIMPTGDNYPVVWVSWQNAKAFCTWSGGLDLPSEAEWEYACRAGTTTLFSFGDNVADLDTHAWTVSNSGALTHLVGGLLPNAWGLYDMHGNVWEWALDDYVPEVTFDFVSGTWRYDFVPNDGSPRVANTTNTRTKSLRGGSWSNAASALSAGSAARFNSALTNTSNDVGFRVVLRIP